MWESVGRRACPEQLHATAVPMSELAPVPGRLHVQLSMLVLNGVQPNELVVKRLAMLGCTGG